jgi:hypothetical protein
VQNRNMALLPGKWSPRPRAGRTRIVLGRDDSAIIRPGWGRSKPLYRPKSIPLERGNLRGPPAGVAAGRQAMNGAEDGLPWGTGVRGFGIRQKEVWSGRRDSNLLQAPHEVADNHTFRGNPAIGCGGVRCVAAPRWAPERAPGERLVTLTACHLSRQGAVPPRASVSQARRKLYGRQTVAGFPISVRSLSSSRIGTK